MQKFIKWWSVATLLIMLMVLMNGALVTKTGSGDGCGTDWPKCNGQLIPDTFSLETIIEYSHRLTSGAAGIFVLVLSILSWIYYGHIRETKFLSFISSFFLIVQALFGAAAVLWPQSPSVLALHFGVSLISFSAVFLLNALIFEIDKKLKAERLVMPKYLRLNTYGILIYSYIVVYTGALVRHTNSSLACPDILSCSKRNGGIPITSSEWVQMGHRTAAMLIWLWITIVFIDVIRKHRHDRLLLFGWASAFILVTLQAIAGILVVLTNLSLSIALLHALFISLLVGLLCYFVLLSTRYVGYTKKS